MGRPRKNFIKVEEVAKPKRTYTKKVKVEAEETPKAKGKYNWKKHVKPKANPEQEVKDLTELLGLALEGQMQSLQRAIENEANFNELAKETEKCLNSIAYHCSQVEENTGSLTLEDVEYSISLIKRVIEHKFKKD